MRHVKTVIRSFGANRARPLRGLANPFASASGCVCVAGRRYEFAECCRMCRQQDSAVRCAFARTGFAKEERLLAGCVRLLKVFD